MQRHIILLTGLAIGIMVAVLLPSREALCLLDWKSLSADHKTKVVTPTVDAADSYEKLDAAIGQQVIGKIIPPPSGKKPEKTQPEKRQYPGFIQKIIDRKPARTPPPARDTSLPGRVMTHGNIPVSIPASDISPLWQTFNQKVETQDNLLQQFTGPLTQKLAEPFTNPTYKSSGKPIEQQAVSDMWKSPGDLERLLAFWGLLSARFTQSVNRPLHTPLKYEGDKCDGDIIVDQLLLEYGINSAIGHLGFQNGISTSEVAARWQDAKNAELKFAIQMQCLPREEALLVGDVLVYVLNDLVSTYIPDLETATDPSDIRVAKLRFYDELLLMLTPPLIAISDVIKVHGPDYAVFPFLWQNWPRLVEIYKATEKSALVVIDPKTWSPVWVHFYGNTSKTKQWYIWPNVKGWGGYFDPHTLSLLSQATIDSYWPVSGATKKWKPEDVVTLFGASKKDAQQSACDASKTFGYSPSGANPDYPSQPTMNFEAFVALVLRPDFIGNGTCDDATTAAIGKGCCDFLDGKKKTDNTPGGGIQLALCDGHETPAVATDAAMGYGSGSSPILYATGWGQETGQGEGTGIGPFDEPSANLAAFKIGGASLFVSYMNELADAAAISLEMGKDFSVEARVEAAEAALRALDSAFATGINYQYLYSPLEMDGLLRIDGRMIYFDPSVLEWHSAEWAMQAGAYAAARIYLSVLTGGYMGGNRSEPAIMRALIEWHKKLMEQAAKKMDEKIKAAGGGAGGGGGGSESPKDGAPAGPEYGQCIMKGGECIGDAKCCQAAKAAKK